MLIYFTEANTAKKIAINPQHVISVFEATGGDFEGKTAVVFIGGNLAVEESVVEVVGAVNGELVNG
jgi:hypothetical protein